jgi:hypothetical protein
MQNTSRARWSRRLGTATVGVFLSAGAAVVATGAVPIALAASHPGPGPGGPGPGPGSCSAKATGTNQHLESLLANLSPAAGSRVQAGETVKVLYTDETALSSTAPVVTIDGKSITATITATSGQTPTYLDDNRGSEGTTCQDWISFVVPSGLSGGKHTASVTAYDSDNDMDSYSWAFYTKRSHPKPRPKKPGIVSSQSLTPNDEGFVVNGQEATGTMTFKLFAPSDASCKGTPAFSETIKVSNGVAETHNTSFVATQPGRWRWELHYSGDSTHPAANSYCGGESFILEN